MLKIGTLQFKCPCGKRTEITGRYGVDCVYSLLFRCECGMNTEFKIFFDMQQEGKDEICIDLKPYAAQRLDMEEFANKANDLHLTFIDFICGKCGELFYKEFKNSKSFSKNFKCKCKENSDISLKINKFPLGIDIELSRNIKIKNRKEEKLK